METKTQKALDLFKNGEIAKAISIFKTFKMGFSSEEKRIIGISHEIFTGNANFYESIGTNVKEVQNSAIEIIKTKYNLI